MKRRLTTPLLLVATLFYTTTCSDLSIDSLTEGVVLNLDFDIFRTPLIVNFLDANPNTTNTPNNLNVRIVGPSSDRIYTTDGRKDLAPQDGILEVSVDREDSISINNPLELTFIAEAPGYLKTVHTAVLYDTAFQFVPVNMISLNNLPLGVSLGRGSFQTNSTGGSASSTAVVTPLTGSKQERASVTVRSGTISRDANGNALSGTVDIQMVHFDNRSEESLNAFPGGLEAMNVIGPNGESMDPVEFVTAGFVALDMFVGSSEVKTFSQPIEVTVGVNPATINPETGAVVKVGDRVPVWSLDDETGIWTFEQEAVITRNPFGQMEASFDADHLSWWNLDWFYGSRCTFRNPVTLQVNTNYESYGAPYTIAQLVDANTGARFGGARYLSLRNGSAINLYNIPTGRNLRVQFLSSASYYCQDVLFESASFNTSCQTEFIIDALQFIPDNPLLIQATVSGICEREDNDITIRPSAWIYYRESGCGYWNWLSYVRRGNFYSNRLVAGRTYDFRVYYGGQRYDFSDIPIESTTITAGNYQLDINLDGDMAIFNIENLRIPERYCDDLLGG
ncbi:MAG: hypothetical protein HRU40_11110 [Saprospiraceae bacterium]|nr:hypothetical protein [Saprospiraceae bacterium]